MSKLTVVSDFDGVLNRYRGWKGEKVLYTPEKGVEEFLEKLHEKYKVVIVSTRDSNDIAAWLYEYGLLDYVDGITNKKVKAIGYIDDRAILFDGNYKTVLDKLDKFKTHWE